MSHFSTTLQRVIRDTGEEQIALAARLQMDPSQLNKYYHGRASVRPATLQKLLAAFPPSHHPALVRAYLLDLIPSECAGQLEIRIRDRDEASPSLADDLRHLPDDVQDALRFIGSKCHERPVYDLVLDLARLLRGDK